MPRRKVPRIPTAALIKWMLLIAGPVAVAAGIVLVVAWFADAWVDARLHAEPGNALYESLGMMQPVGDGRFWLIIVLAFLLHDTRWLRGEGLIGMLDRGLVLLVAIGASTLACLILKLIVRRNSPILAITHDAFRGFDDGVFNLAGLSFPSMSTAVAFAGATVLTGFFPRAAGAWFLAAVLATLGSLMRHEFYLSDTVAGAIIGAAPALAILRLRAKASATQPSSPPRDAP